METGNNIAEGTFKITLATASQYIIMALFTTTFQTIGKTEKILKLTISTVIITILLLVSIVSFLETTRAALACLIAKSNNFNSSNL